MSLPDGPSTGPRDGARPGGPGDDVPSPPAKSNRGRLLAVAAVVALAAAGVVAWLVIPDRSPSSSALSTVTGAAVKQILLDGTELTKLLDQPFEEAPGSPVYGGFDEMDGSSPPGDCIGVVDVAPQSVYLSADVQTYVRETWAAAEPGHGDLKPLGSKPLGSKVMFVKEAVVTLPSAADARALFTKFSEQWKRCDGQAVNQGPPTRDADSPPHLPGTEMHITDFRATDTVLAASIVLDRNPKAPDTRALGVQGNCLIGVLIAFTGVENATGAGDPNSSSTDAVRAMMDKASELS